MNIKYLKEIIDFIKEDTEVLLINPTSKDKKYNKPDDGVMLLNYIATNEGHDNVLVKKSDLKEIKSSIEKILTLLADNNEYCERTAIELIRFMEEKYNL